jgi:hypothetical protein
MKAEEKYTNKALRLEIALEMVKPYNSYLNDSAKGHTGRIKCNSNIG